MPIISTRSRTQINNYIKFDLIYKTREKVLFAFFLVSFSFLVFQSQVTNNLNRGKGGRHFLMRERLNRGIAAVPLSRGVLLSVPLSSGVLLSVAFCFCHRGKAAAGQVGLEVDGEQYNLRTV